MLCTACCVDTSGEATLSVGSGAKQVIRGTDLEHEAAWRQGAKDLLEERDVFDECAAAEVLEQQYQDDQYWNDEGAIEEETCGEVLEAIVEEEEEELPEEAEALDNSAHGAEGTARTALLPDGAQGANASASSMPALPEVRQPAVFDIVLPMTPGKSTGFCFDFSESKYIRVAKIEQKGPLLQYNASAQAGEEVCVGDFIIAVNGESGDARQMLKELHRTTLARLSMRRPFQFTVGPLDRSGHSLGLDISYAPNSESIAIKEVLAQGVVTRWNASACRELRVQEGDHILAVNGKRDLAAAQLAKALSSSETIELFIARPACL
mmetsp:Transcript_122412/g.305559  ORF Transcript_122412/g.305559 Transcript_122412/m.305559 type:complete len:322 (+) Transcript_122412:83-1048(+)